MILVIIHMTKTMFSMYLKFEEGNNELNCFRNMKSCDQISKVDVNENVYRNYLIYTNPYLKASWGPKC